MLRGLFFHGKSALREADLEFDRVAGAVPCRGQLDVRTTGIAGSRGVQLLPKPEQENGEWRGSNT
jgi:hypothetical protein